MSPDLVILDANQAYLAVVGRTRQAVVGSHLFEAFPPQPDALDETGVSRVQRSFERARDTGCRCPTTRGAPCSWSSAPRTSPTTSASGSRDATMPGLEILPREQAEARLAKV